MIEIGVAIGSGKVIEQSGPIGSIFEYIFAGLIVYFVITSLGEMATIFAIKRLLQFLGRFVDEALCD